MVVPLIPPVTVPNPTPIIPRYGMFSVAVGPKDLPNSYSMGSGVRYKTAATVLPEGLELLCTTPTMSFKTDCGTWVTGTPFAIQASMTAGTVGMPQSEIEATLRERLLAGEQAVAEAVYSAGTFGQAPSLANNTPAATALAGTLSLIEGIMALESWLAARSGLPGVLYIPTIASAMLSAEGAFWRDGGIWRTAAGNAVAIGNFAGLTPAGGAPAAGSTNLYITESLTIWRTPDSQIFISPFEANVTFTTNQVAALARREYVITHAGLVAGVESVLSPFCCGRLPA